MYIIIWTGQKYALVIVGELNIVFSLLGSYGQSFWQSRDRWSCDISRSEFYPFLVADSSWRGPLFFVSVFSSNTLMQIMLCEPFLYTRRNVSFYWMPCSTSSSVEQLLYLFYGLGLLSYFVIMCTVYVYKMYIIAV